MNRLVLHPYGGNRKKSTQIDIANVLSSLIKITTNIIEIIIRETN